MSIGRRGRKPRSRADEARGLLQEAEPLLLLGEDPLAARAVIDGAKSTVNGLIASGVVDVESARLFELFWIQAGRCAEAAMELSRVRGDFLRAVGAEAGAAADRVIAEKLVEELVPRWEGDRLE